MSSNDTKPGAVPNGADLPSQSEAPPLLIYKNPLRATAGQVVSNEIMLQFGSKYWPVLTSRIELEKHFTDNEIDEMKHSGKIIAVRMLETKRSRAVLAKELTNSRELVRELVEKYVLHSLKDLNADHIRFTDGVAETLLDTLSSQHPENASLKLSDYQRKLLRVPLSETFEMEESARYDRWMEEHRVREEVNGLPEFQGPEGVRRLNDLLSRLNADNWHFQNGWKEILNEKLSNLKMEINSLVLNKETAGKIIAVENNRIHINEKMLAKFADTQFRVEELHKGLWEKIRAELFDSAVSDPKAKKILEGASGFEIAEDAMEPISHHVSTEKEEVVEAKPMEEADLRELAKGNPKIKALFEDIDAQIQRRLAEIEKSLYAKPLSDEEALKIVNQALEHINPEGLAGRMVWVGMETPGAKFVVPLIDNVSFYRDGLRATVNKPAVAGFYDKGEFYNVDKHSWDNSPLLYVRGIASPGSTTGTAMHEALHAAFGEIYGTTGNVYPSGDTTPPHPTFDKRPDGSIIPLRPVTDIRRELFIEALVSDLNRNGRNIDLLRYDLDLSREYYTGKLFHAEVLVRIIQWKEQGIWNQNPELAESYKHLDNYIETVVKPDLEAYEAHVKKNPLSDPAAAKWNPETDLPKIDLNDYRQKNPSSVRDKLMPVDFEKIRERIEALDAEAAKEFNKRRVWKGKLKRENALEAPSTTPLWTKRTTPNPSRNNSPYIDI